jgi:hypothetical protein
LIAAPSVAALGYLIQQAEGVLDVAGMFALPALSL